MIKRLEILGSDNQQLPSFFKSITKKAFPGLTAEDINGGDCYNWAAIVKTLLPKARIFYLSMYGGHVFVKLKDRFYDAENPTGVTDWRKLKAFSTAKDVPKYPDERLDELSLKDVMKKWKLTDSELRKYIAQVNTKD